ncbi:MAG: hypothetical protein KIT72_00950 [Polyangiaceae bacterium]|nr:hypothetical protein [Polyangiaceae bacterium]MCW5788964.1 hypothetical protein [Polyangiaceae bacterium]
MLRCSPAELVAARLAAACIAAGCLVTAPLAAQPADALDGGAAPTDEAPSDNPDQAGDAGPAVGEPSGQPDEPGQAEPPLAPLPPARSGVREDPPEDPEDTEDDQDAILVLPTVTVGGERPTRETHPRLFRFARRVDFLLAEAVQDMDLSLSVAEPANLRAGELTEDRLITLASDVWVLLPELSVEAGQLRLRLSVVAPHGKVVMVRSERVPPAELEVRLMVMVRDLVQAGRGAGARAVEPGAGALTTAQRARGEGRAVLALNSALLGGYVGYSLQRAGGSNDPRLTYPLIALGTGVGLGGSLIVADEWDVGLGDAWFLSAGMVWPTLTGVLLASAYNVREDDRFAYGLVGAVAGVGLGTFALTFRGMGEGGAAITHSGGLVGALAGSLVQIGYEGSSDGTPTLGAGYGAGIGVLSAGILATQIYLSSSRVLMIDLGIGLGALTGAAAASPLVFGDDPGPAENRAWAGSVAGGAVLGALIAYLITTSDSGSAAHEGGAPSQATVLPFFGSVSTGVEVNGRMMTAPALGVSGQF